MLYNKSKFQNELKPLEWISETTSKSHNNFKLKNLQTSSFRITTYGSINLRVTAKLFSPRIS